MKILVTSAEKMRRYRERHAARCACGKSMQRESKRCVACNRQRRVEQLRASPARLVHGYARKGVVHPLHRVWSQMLQRCENSNDKRYLRYGGRGVKVCPEWHDFPRWLADVGARPAGLTMAGRARFSLDRIDNDGDYEPGNVRWATPETQARNR